MNRPALRELISSWNRLEVENPIGAIDVPANGHIFGDDLTCICRQHTGHRIVYRWRFGGRFPRGFQKFRRRQFGDYCGQSWEEQQKRPTRCEGVHGGRTHPSKFLGTLVELSLTRSTKWSRIYAASRLPKGITKPGWKPAPEAQSDTT